MSNSPSDTRDTRSWKQTGIESTAKVMLNKCERNKKNKTADLCKKWVIILDEGMPFFPIFAHDIDDFACFVLQHQDK